MSSYRFEPVTGSSLWRWRAWRTESSGKLFFLSLAVFRTSPQAWELSGRLSVMWLCICNCFLNFLRGANQLWQVLAGRRMSLTCLTTDHTLGCAPLLTTPMSFGGVPTTRQKTERKSKERGREKGRAREGVGEGEEDKNLITTND